MFSKKCPTYMMVVANLHILSSYLDEVASTYYFLLRKMFYHEILSRIIDIILSNTLVVILKGFPSHFTVQER